MTKNCKINYEKNFNEIKISKSINIINKNKKIN